MVPEVFQVSRLPKLTSSQTGLRAFEDGDILEHELPWMNCVAQVAVDSFFV
jgi:hypothetical protein